MKNSYFRVVLVVIAIVLFFAINARAEEFTIIGYGPGETAVKGEAERQAEEMVKSWGTRKPAKIIIQGYADNTGNSAENDNIGRVRANEMEAFISEKINAEKITARSKGDSENARKVVVTVEFAVYSAPARSVTAPTADWFLTKDGKRALVFTYLTLIFLALVVASIYFSLIGRRRKAERAKAVEKAKIEAEAKVNTETILATRWIDAVGLVGDKNNYSVRVIKKGDGNWYTPFMTLEDSSKPLFRSDFQDVKRAVRGCVKNSRYADQFARLLAADVDIKKK